MELTKRRRKNYYQTIYRLRSSPGTDDDEEEKQDTSNSIDLASATTRDWSSLTDSLLLSVLRRLSTLEDFFAFRGVCRSWRALAAPTPEALAFQTPLILLTRFPGYTEVFYDIVRCRLYRAQLPWRVPVRYSLAYAHGHLVTTTDKPNTKLLLWNLFTEARVRLPKAPEPFRCVRLSARPDSSACSILLSMRRSAMLQYLRVGDSLWTVIIKAETLRNIDDFIFFDGKLYGLTAKMQLLAVELHGQELEFKQLGAGTSWEALTEGVHLERSLGESDGELLAICCRFGNGFDIFRWDFGRQDWEEVLNLGERAVFIGSTGFAGSVVATGLGIRGNCIYYVQYRKDAWYVFSLEDKSVQVVSPDSPGLLRGQTALAPIWVFPSIC